MLDLFKKKLQEGKFKILKEFKVDDFPEIRLNKIPGKDIGKSNRRQLYDFEHFIIKSCDLHKFGFNPDKLDDLREEVRACHKYEDKEIKFADKIAIIHVGKNSFLVEKKLIPFEYERWEKSGLLKEAKEILEVAQKKYPNLGDFKLEHIGLDPYDKTMKFFDVFPQKSTKGDSAHK